VSEIRKKEIKRIIYILILITAFAFNLELRASEKKIKLDSIVTQNQRKQEFAYDNNGNRILYVDYDWDNNLNNWVRYWKSEYTYDDNGNQILTVSYEWDNTLNDWVRYYKSEINFDYSYDTLSVINPLDYVKYKFIQRINYNWDYNNNDWVIVDTTNFFYSDFNPTSIEKEIAANPNDNFLIFPNPSADKISVDLGEIGGVGFADLSIYDILGNEIMTIPNYNNKTEIDVNNIPIGTYTIQIQTPTGSVSQRLLVNR
jgi:uncharacterized protein YkuJ